MLPQKIFRILHAFVCILLVIYNHLFLSVLNIKLVRIVPAFSSLNLLFFGIVQVVPRLLHTLIAFYSLFIIVSFETMVRCVTSENLLGSVLYFEACYQLIYLKLFAGYVSGCDIQYSVLQSIQHVRVVFSLVMIVFNRDPGCHPVILLQSSCIIIIS